MLSHVQLFATPWTVAFQSPLSMGILQARILEWVAYPFSRGSFQTRNLTGVSCIARRLFTSWATMTNDIKEMPRMLQEHITGWPGPREGSGKASQHKWHRAGCNVLLCSLMLYTSCSCYHTDHGVKNLPAMQETRVRSLGQEAPLEKEMATHSSILTWRIPWPEKPGGVHSMGSQRVGHDWATNAFIVILSTCFSLLPACELFESWWTSYSRSPL